MVGERSEPQQGAPQQTFSVTLAGYADYQAPKKSKAIRVEDEDDVEEEASAAKESTDSKKAKPQGSCVARIVAHLTAR